MSIERSKALIIALHNIWNTGNLEKIPEVYSPACMVHWPHGWGPGSRGHAQIKKAIAHSRTVFPDWHEETSGIFSRFPVFHILCNAIISALDLSILILMLYPQDF
jgi:hypothetical protein